MQNNKNLISAFKFGTKHVIFSGRRIIEPEIAIFLFAMFPQVRPKLFLNLFDSTEVWALETS